MHTIGLRAQPKGVTFAVFDAESRAIINVEKLLIPAAFEVPDALKYVRNNTLDVIREYEVRKAGIRLQEPMAQSPNTFRTQIEGVIQEAFASSVVEAFFVGPIAVIAHKLGMERDRIKPMVEGQNDLEVENWATMSREEREAILYALGAENA